MIQKKLLITMLFMTMTAGVSGQHALSESRRSSAEQFVYKLNREDVRKLYMKGKTPDESMLHTLVLRCAAAGSIPPLPKGNYVTVRAAGNELVYGDHTVDDFYFSVVKDEKVMLFLSDTLGRVIDNATVGYGRKRLTFDPATQTYHTRRIDHEKTIEVDNGGVLHYIEFEDASYHTRRNNFFRIAWQRTKSTFNRLFVPRAPVRYKYDGFVVFGKPKYKPGETVRFKAYIHSNGKAYDKETEVKLTSYYPVRMDTTLTTLHPYRPGMYEWQFKLSDSLRMSLDNNYTVALKTKGKRTNNIQGSFRYEAYELGRITFDARTDKTQYTQNDTVKLKLAAKDENNMPVYDGRVEITVQPSPGSYTTKYDASQVFIPDETWRHTFDLTGKASEEIILPDSVFVAHTAMDYDVECTFLDAGNEQHSQRIRLYMDRRNSLIDFNVERGMLTIREVKNGKNVVTKAQLTLYNKEVDRLYRDSVTLPHTMPLMWMADNYEVSTRTSGGDFYVDDIKGEVITYRFFRENGNARLVVDNPAGIPFWYTVRKGKRVIDKGYATALDRSYRDRGKNGYTMQLSYLLGEAARTVQGHLLYGEKNISMEVNTPTTVYPGQTATVNVLVKDRKGRPVRNADVTAFAFTSKFGPHSPDVTVFGKSVSARPFDNRSYDTDKERMYSKVPMEWQLWKQRMGLDSIEYYKFLHPKTYYAYAEKVPDEVTQVAPYVVIDGEVQGVHILWIDEQPYYFHQAQQLNVYSFPVTPGFHSLKLRTAHREITAEPVYVQKGMKTIISIDGKQSAAVAKALPGKRNIALRITVKAYGKRERGILSKREMGILKDHLITVENTTGTVGFPNTNNYTGLNIPAIVNAGGVYYYLNRSVTARYDYASRSYIGDPVLAGPFPYRGFSAGKRNIGLLYADTALVTPFEIEGGYRYRMYPGYLKQTSWEKSPINRFIPPFTPNVSFTEHALTADGISRMFHQQILNRAGGSWGSLSPAPTGEAMGCRIRLEMGRSADRRTAIDPLMIRLAKDTVEYLYYGKTRDFDKLPQGDYQMDIIFADTTRYRLSVTLRREGVTYLKVDAIRPLPADSISRRAFDRLYAELVVTRTVDPLAAHALYAGKETVASVPAQTVGSFDNANYGRKVITGVVYDSAGEPLIGATVSIKDTSTAVITGMDGTFMLPDTGTGKLLVSYIGFKPFATQIKPGYNYRIEMKEESHDLEEVVVMGYSTTTRKALSGAYVNMENSTGTAIPEALAGKLAGMQVRGAGNEFPEGWSKANALRTNFHDDAFWRPRLSTGKDGSVTFEVIYPDDITGWNAHFIAVGGRKQTDRTQLNIRSFKPVNAQLSLPQFAILGDSLNGIGRLTNHLGDTLTVTRSFEREGRTSQADILLAKTYVDTIPVTANTLDSIGITYSLTMKNGYFDGERRTIPVYRPGIPETHGEFAVLGDTALRHIPTDPALGEVTVHAEASALQLILDEIERIDRYPYLCNEQMASKIKALLSKKRLYTMLGRKFEEDGKIRNLIGRLERNQNNKRLWGWWNRDLTEWWISKQVVEALLDAQTAGYRVNLDKQTVWDALAREYAGIVLAQPDATPGDRLRSMEIVLATDTIAGAQVDSLLSLASETMLGSMYWSEKKCPEGTPGAFRLPYTGNTDHTLMAYRILRKAGGHEKELEKIRNYFFETRKNGSWQNTYESSRILETILPDLLRLGSGAPETALTINGKRFDTFPVTEKVAAGETVEVRKEGIVPVFVTTWQQAWNRLPERTAKGFSVTTMFQDDDRPVTVLQAGKRVDLTVSVTVDADAGYVMIEVPIPAGCSYASKAGGRAWNEVHREYHPEKVSIFCNRLSKGKYDFVIELLPRYTGRYHLNPAKAELMYFPTFFGREAMEIREIR